MSKTKKIKKIGNFHSNYEFLESAVANETNFYLYLDMFREIDLTMFEWLNLPSTMDSRWLERTLYFYGVGGVLRDDSEGGIINTEVSSSGQINKYGLPTLLNCHSINYHTDRKLYTGPTTLPNESKEKDQLESAVLVMNDWEKTPMVTKMQLFAQRLAECDSTAMTNIKAQKTPVMILAKEEQRLTMENLYSQYDGNRPFIFGNSDNMSEQPISSIVTGAPFVADKVQEYKKELINDALTYMGINNIMVEKKERLTDDEANSNNEFINLNLLSRLAPRQQACKQINELFGTNIEVRVRSDLHNIVKNMLSSFKELEPKEDTSELKKEVKI